MPKPLTLLTPRPSAPRQPGLPDWVLPGKFDPPTLDAGLVSRRTLLAQWQHSPLPPLTLLLAPPGFGKTTLLGQCHRQLHDNGFGVAWLALDENDSDPGRFIGQLALALRNAGLEPALNTALLQQPLPAQALTPTLTTLIHACRDASRDIALVLDDYDRASCAAVDEALLRLIDHAGPRLHLLLASRQPPALPLARLAAQRRLIRLNSDQLALDAEETAALLGEAVPADIASALRDRTEGWPVALQLARLWLAGDPRRHDQITGFSGRSIEIAAYLTEQVVNALDPDSRAFLLATAPLSRFDAHLADHVRQRSDSGLLLPALARFHGLLIPLDGEHAWFRYHPLFAEYLQQQLERERPGAATTIHQRAAHWFGARGELIDAVQHAAAAGALLLAADYLADAGTWQLLLWHSPAQVRSLLRHFSDREIRDTPALNLTQAQLHLTLGELSHARLLLERFRNLADAVRAPFERDYTVVVAGLRHLGDEICGNPHGLPQLAAQAAALDDDDHLGRGLLACICAATALGLGNFVAAERHARYARAAMQRGDCTTGVNHALLLLGQSLHLRGEPNEAEALYQQALSLSRQHQHSHRSLDAAACCLLAQLHYERGRYAEADALLAPALTVLEQHDGWLELYASAYQTALGLARRQDHSGRSALALLDHIEALARVRRLGRLSDLVTVWRLNLLLESPERAVGDALVARSGGESSFDDCLQRAPRWRQRSILGFALSRWHLRAGRNGAALKLLQRLEHVCRSDGDLYHLPQVQAHIALVLHQRGQLDDAATYLRAVLDRIALTRNWQLVAELGLPAKAMLRTLRQHDPDIIAGTTRALTIQTLLEHLSDEATTLDALSEREGEVLAQLALGHSNKRIGRELQLSENTVKFHLKNLYRKLGARTREAALAQALRRGLLHPRRY